MLLRNIILAFRYLRENKFFSFLNIFGLSSGIAVAILVFMWVSSELSYDTYNKNIDQLHHIVSNQFFSESNKLHTKSTPFPLQSHLKDNYPEVVDACHYTNNGSFPVGYKDKIIRLDNIYSSTYNFPRMLQCKLIDGDIDCLKKADNIIITEKVAAMFFGNDSPVGKELNLDGVKSFTVGAVVQSLKNKSSANFQIIFPVEIMFPIFDIDPKEWGNNWPYTLIQLAKGTDAKAFSEKIKNVHKEHGSKFIEYSLKPLKYDRLYYNSGEAGRIQSVYLLSTIGFIIVLIAAINFINLTTARSEKRLIEIGIRKVNGAESKDIVFQLLIEKLVTIFICLILSIFLAYIAMPLFNYLSGKNIDFVDAANFISISSFIAIGLLVTIIAGLYPSIHMASIKLMKSIRRKTITKSNRRFSFRNILVVIQFSLSIALISSSIIIRSQLNYILKADLGYEKDNLIRINLVGETSNNYSAMLNKLEEIPGVQLQTYADKPPFWVGNNTWGYQWEGKDPELKVLINRMNVGTDYIKTMKMDLVEGEFFEASRYMDRDSIEELPVILNQEAIRQMKIKNPIGKFFGTSSQRGKIVGVVKDFNFNSLHRTIDPLVLLPARFKPYVIIYRINPENAPATINQVKKAWNEVNGGIPISMSYFDETIKWMYRADSQTFELFGFFTLVAIIIACLGLLGLSVFATERRIKEIGVRKVNGARVIDILLMLNISFIKLVGISILLGSYISYSVMDLWLGKFAYKTNMHIWMFALAGVLAIIVSAITVSIQSYKAASQNPVKALKYE
ncbi:MAG: ABC transporter permease [Marinifilaceae bacterium]|nr:ABC transporter permease [Marinifilaceae bacterium]